MASLSPLFPPKRQIAQAIVAAVACLQVESRAAPGGACPSGDAACLRAPQGIVAANDVKDLIPA